MITFRTSGQATHLSVIFKAKFGVVNNSPDHRDSPEHFTNVKICKVKADCLMSEH